MPGPWTLDLGTTRGRHLSMPGAWYLAKDLNLPHIGRWKLRPGEEREGAREREREVVARPGRATVWEV